MKKNEGFEFLPKKWLGDTHILSMDWDVRGMHITLIALSWQKEPQGYLLNDETIIKKLLGNPDDNDWQNRIKPQLLKAWEITVLKNENGIDETYWVQSGVLDTVAKKKIKDSGENLIPSTRKPRRKKVELLDTDEPLFEGFSLASIIKSNPKTTILLKPSTEEETFNIWNIGTQYLMKNGLEKRNATSLLARWAKKYSKEEVAKTMAELSLKNSQPIDVISFVTSILEKNVGSKKPRIATVAL